MVGGARPTSLSPTYDPYIQASMHSHAERGNEITHDLTGCEFVGAAMPRWVRFCVGLSRQSHSYNTHLVPTLRVGMHTQPGPGITLQRGFEY